MQSIIRILFALAMLSITVVASSQSCTWCEGNPQLTMTSSCTGSASITYQWTSPTGVIYNTAAVTADENGTWTWQCTDDVNGCFDGGTYSVTLVNKPNVTINASGGCLGDNVAVTASGVPGGYTYSWDFDTGATPATSTTSTQNVTYSTTGTKTITLTIDNGTCSFDYSQDISISEITGSVICN